MLEHLVVFLVIMRVLKGLFMERRGKTGLKDLIVKVGIRLGQRFSLVRNRLNSQLEKEASKTISDLLQ